MSTHSQRWHYCYHIMKNYLVFISTLFLINCSSSNEINVDLQSAERMAISEEINHARSMFIMDSLLWITDPDQSHLFKVFNLHDQKGVYPVGKLGAGPCDISFPSFVQKLDDKTISIFVKQRLTFIELNYPELLGDDGDCISGIERVNIDFQRILRIGDNHIFGFGIFEKKYALMDMNKSEVPELYFDYHYGNDLKEQHDYRNIAMASQGDLIAKPDGSKIVFAAKYFGAFDIIGITDLEPKIIFRSEFDKPIFTSESGNVIKPNFSKENNLGFLSTAVTDDFIYMLYSGKEMNQENYSSDIVLIYNWEGKKIKTILLEKSVSLIAVDSEDKFLIGYHDDGQANLYKFKLL